MRRGNLYNFRPQSTSGMSVGTDTATTCMHIAQSGKHMGCFKSSHFADITHFNLFPMTFIQYTRSLIMSDQGSSSSISYKTPSSDHRQRSPPNLPFRNPASLSDISAQSHPRKHILHIKRNFYQSRPPNCQSGRSQCSHAAPCDVCISRPSYSRKKLEI